MISVIGNGFWYLLLTLYSTGQLESFYWPLFWSHNPTWLPVFSCAEMTRQGLLHLFHIQWILPCELLLWKAALFIMNVGFISVLTSVLGTMCAELNHLCFILGTCLWEEYGYSVFYKDLLQAVKMHLRGLFHLLSSKPSGFGRI